MTRSQRRGRAKARRQEQEYMRNFGERQCPDLVKYDSEAPIVAKLKRNARARIVEKIGGIRR